MRCDDVEGSICLSLSRDASPGGSHGGSLGSALGGGNFAGTSAVAGNSTAVAACRRRSPPQPRIAGAVAARRRARVSVGVTACRRARVGVGVGDSGDIISRRERADIKPGRAGVGGSAGSSRRGSVGAGVCVGVTVGVCARHTPAEVLLGRRYLDGRAFKPD